MEQLTCIDPLTDFDHGILSPPGHASKASRKVIIDKLAKAVNEAYGAAEAEHAAKLEAERAARLRQYAAELRALADRGMRPRVHRAKAAELEAEADRLDADVKENDNDHTDTLDR